MTAATHIFQACLILTCPVPFSITAKATAAAITQDCCHHRGLPVTAAPVIAASSVTAHCAALDVTVDYRPGPGADTRLMVTISRLDGAAVSDDEALGLLASLCGKLMHQFPADRVQWLSETMELPAARFLDACAPVRPRRVKPRSKLRSDICTADEALLDHDMPQIATLAHVA